MIALPTTCRRRRPHTYPARAASATAKKVAKFSALLPILWMVLSVAAVGAGQAWAGSLASARGQCSFFLPRHLNVE